MVVEEPPAWLAPIVAELREALSIPADVRCLTRHQAADALGVSLRLLDKLHSTGEAPPSLLVAGRRVYPVEHLRRWVAERIKAG